MLNKYLLRAAAVGSLGCAAAVTAIDCAPAEDLSVTLVTACEIDKLNLSDPAEATVKIYTQTAAELRDRVTKLNARFTAVCNAINRELGQAEGADIHTACNKIADRVIAANALAPAPDGGVAPQWVAINFDVTCALASAVVTSCVDECSEKKGCDPGASCAPAQTVGKCAGRCNTCTATGDAVPCNGACQGECSLPPIPERPDGGLPACQGECRGTCMAPLWQGACSAGCKAAFRGKCAGTCTGACDGLPFPTQGVDAGDGDAGDGGAPVIPGSGVCNGFCTGACAGEASGACGAPGVPAPCAGEFRGGLCPGNNSCVGTCVGVNAACTTTCKGVCAFATDTCEGSCAGCEGQLSEAACTGVPACPDVNPICGGACALRGAIQTTCPPTSVDIRIAGDYKFAEALAKHADEFSAAAREANLLSTNLGGVLQRTPAEFRAIGVVRDNARLCAIDAPAQYDELRKLVNEAVGASLVVRGSKF